MPAGFVQQRRQRGGGRWGRIGQSGRGGFSRLRFRIGPFEFGVGLRNLLPSIILVGMGTPSARPRPPHPLHFAPGGLPTMIEACIAQPWLCAAGAASRAGPLGKVSAATLYTIFESERRRKEKALRDKLKRELEIEEMRGRMRDVMNQAQLDYELRNRQAMIDEPSAPPLPSPMPIELPDYYDYPALPPLVSPQRVRPTRPQRQVDVVDIPRPQVPDIVLPAPFATPGIAWPVPIRLPAPRIAPKPVQAPVELPFRFPNTSPLVQPFVAPLPNLVPQRFAPGLPAGMPPMAIPLTPIQAPGVPSQFMSPGMSFASPQTAACICPKPPGAGAGTRTATGGAAKKKRKKCFKRTPVSCGTRERI